MAVLAAENEAPLPGLAGLRLNAASQLAVALGGKVVALGDEDEIAAVSGFPDERAVVVFQEAKRSRSDFHRGGSSAGTASTTARSRRRCRARSQPSKSKKAKRVTKGQRLLTLEAMKMEHALTAPFDGTVAELNAKAGAQVTEGTVLVKLDPDEQ